jgi:hypothetical protein
MIHSHRPDVTFIVDGKMLTAPAGMLLTDSSRKTEIEVPKNFRGLAMGTDLHEASIHLEDQVRQWRHPIKNGLITVAGDEDGDIPELTAEFLLGGAQIEKPEVLNSN